MLFLFLCKRLHTFALPLCPNPAVIPSVWAGVPWFVIGEHCLDIRPVTFYYCFILGAFDHITWSQRSLNLLALVHVSFFQSIYHLYKRLKSCQTSRVMRFCIIQKMYFHCAVVFSHFASPTLRLFSGKMLSTLKSTKLKFSTSQNKFVHEHKRSL